MKKEVVVIFCLCIWFFTSCKSSPEIPVYYVDYKINDKELDSILHMQTNLRLIYYDDHRNFRIIPITYKTGDYDSMRILKTLESLPKDVPGNSVKYEVYVKIHFLRIAPIII